MRNVGFVLLVSALAVAPLARYPALAATKDFAIQGYALPADKPVTVVLMRPDVDVGELQVGGLPQPNADWTNAARTEITTALRGHMASRNIAVTMMDEVTPTPEATRLVADYDALHSAVVGSILAHKYAYTDGKLPTKKGVFDYTLGPGAAGLTTLSGANYGLFMVTIDQFSSASRKAMQVVGALGCIIGACMITTGGVHVAYVSLVELETGNIVWFNVLRGSKGDVRDADGARGMVSAIMADMPSRPGELKAGTDEVAAK